MRRYRSPNYRDNYLTCDQPERISDDKQQQASAAQTLNVLQWENKKAVLRTNKRSLPVVQG